MTTSGGGAGGPSVSIVLPAWNEADGLRVAVEEAVASLDELVADGQLGWYEIIVVDDGSTDATGEIAAQLAEEHAVVRTVSHERNRGVGAGLRSGLAQASATYLVSTDADMPVDLAEIGPAVALLEGSADLVAGSRTERANDGSVRWLATAGYDVVIRVAFGVRVDDVNFAFKVARADLLRHLDLQSEGAFIDAELVALATLRGYEVRVVPMVYRPRQYGQSSTLSVRTLGRLLRELVLEFPRLRREARRAARAAGQRNG